MAYNNSFNAFGSIRINNNSNDLFSGFNSNSNNLSSGFNSNSNNLSSGFNSNSNNLFSGFNNNLNNNMSKKKFDKNFIIQFNTDTAVNTAVENLKNKYKAILLENYSEEYLKKIEVLECEKNRIFICSHGLPGFISLERGKGDAIFTPNLNNTGKKLAEAIWECILMLRIRRVSLCCCYGGYLSPKKRKDIDEFNDKAHYDFNYQALGFDTAYTKIFNNNNKICKSILQEGFSVAYSFLKKLAEKITVDNFFEGFEVTARCGPLMIVPKGEKKVHHRKVKDNLDFDEFITNKALAKSRHDTIVLTYDYKDKSIKTSPKDYACNLLFE